MDPRQNDAVEDPAPDSIQPGDPLATHPALTIPAETEDEPITDSSWDELIQRLQSHAPSAPRYQSKGILGSGGMGTVYNAWDMDLRRSLALKVMRSTDDEAGSGGNERQAMARFVEEAQITGQLEHPGIVPVHELGVDAQGQLYFAMQKLRGEELSLGLSRLAAMDEKERNSPDGRAALARLLEVILKACDAVGFAHSKNVIHRDLKPSNIMVGSYGRVHVVDWGLAKAIGTEERHRSRLIPQSQDTVTSVQVERDIIGVPGDMSPLMTRDGTVMGTPAYMPPEQARGEVDALDERSDVYAMGAILYHALAGSPPFMADSELVHNRAVLDGVLHGPPPPVGEVAPKASAELGAIAEKAMARNPEDRYPDMAALAEDLRSFLDGRVVSAYGSGARLEFTKWVRRNPTIAALAGSILLTIMASLAAVGWITSAHADRLEDQAAVTGGVLTFLEEMLTSVDPSASGNRADVMMVDVLNNASEELQGATELSPEIRMELHKVIANTYGEIGGLLNMRQHLEAELDLRTGASKAPSMRKVRVLTGLAELDALDGNYRAAKERIRAAIEMADEVLPPDHWASVSARGSSAEIEVMSADLHEKFETLLLSSAKMYISFYGDTRSEAEVADQFRAIVDRMGRAAEAGDRTGAAKILRDFVAPLIEGERTPKKEVCVAFVRAGSTLEDVSMIPEAEAFRLGAFDLAHEMFTGLHALKPLTAQAIGLHYKKFGPVEKADEFMGIAHEEFDATFGADAKTFRTAVQHAEVKIALGDHGAAEVLIDRAAAGAMGLGRPGRGTGLLAVTVKARLLESKGLAMAALDAMDEAMDDADAYAGKRGKKDSTRFYLARARYALAADDLGKAEESLGSAETWLERKKKNEHELYGEFLELRASLLEARGDGEGAARVLEERAELRRGLGGSRR